MLLLLPILAAMISRAIQLCFLILLLTGSTIIAMVILLTNILLPGRGCSDPWLLLHLSLLSNSWRRQRRSRHGWIKRAVTKERWGALGNRCGPWSWRGWGRRSLEPGTCIEPTLISRTPWLWARRPEAWSTMSTRIRWIIVMDYSDQNNNKNLRRTKRRKVNGHWNTAIEAHNSSCDSLRSFSLFISLSIV